MHFQVKLREKSMYFKYHAVILQSFLVSLEKRFLSSFKVHFFPIKLNQFSFSTPVGISSQQLLSHSAKKVLSFNLIESHLYFTPKVLLSILTEQTNLTSQLQCFYNSILPISTFTYPISINRTHNFM